MPRSDVFFLLMKNPVSNGRRVEPASRFVWAFALILFGSVLIDANSVDARQAGNGDDSVHVHWKQVAQAQVKLDDKTPLAWNVFQPDKKDKKDKKKSSELILVLLGHRYLMLDTRARTVYAVPLSEIHAPGTDFDSNNLAKHSQLIPSTDWSVRDVGPAESILVTLGDYGRTLEVVLPHPPDLRAFY
jgi:hypothetical protein